MHFKAFIVNAMGVGEIIFYTGVASIWILFGIGWVPFTYDTQALVKPIWIKKSGLLKKLYFVTYRGEKYFINYDEVKELIMN